MAAATTRRPIRALLIVAATTAASVVAVAAPAGAQPVSPSRPALCVRAENQWARRVTANKQAKTAFDKAQALQNRLLRAGRTLVAHRLDTRLGHLRAIHTTLVARGAAIAARVQGRCSGRPPILNDFGSGSAGT
jgi:hypothetical protein